MPPLGWTVAVGQLPYGAQRSGVLMADKRQTEEPGVAERCLLVASACSGDVLQQRALTRSVNPLIQSSSRAHPVPRPCLPSPSINPRPSPFTLHPSPQMNSRDTDSPPRTNHQLTEAKCTRGSAEQRSEIPSRPPALTRGLLLEAQPYQTWGPSTNVFLQLSCFPCSPIQGCQADVAPCACHPAPGCCLLPGLAGLPPRTS